MTYSSADDDFEQLNANNPDAKQQKSKCTEQLMSKILRELDAVKSENKLLHQKNNTLVAKVDSLQVQLKANNREVQARQESMEQKLKVAELETKLAKQQETAELVAKLAEEQMNKMVEAKMGEEIAKMKEKQRKKLEEVQLKSEKQLQSLRNEMAEKDRNSLLVMESDNNSVKLLDKEMSKMQQKLTALGVENCQFRKDNETVKIENQLLRTKVEALQALLQAQLETMEQKLRVAELEKKMAQQQMEVEMADKLNKAEEKIEEFDRKMGTVKSKAAEDTGKLQKQKLITDAETKLTDKDRELTQVRMELENMAKQLVEVSTELGGKIGNLESQTKFEWSNNHWHIDDQKQVRASGLTVTKTIGNDEYTNVRAQDPISRSMLALIPGLKLVHWEVQMMNESASHIGWIGPNFPLDTKWIGDHPGSFAIISCHWGTYFESNRKLQFHGKCFDYGDVIGSGLLLTRDGRFKLFFTLNGQMNGEPIVMKDSQDLLLYPAIGLFWKNTSVEANFGAYPAGKPFKFNVKVHETELFS